MTTQSRRSLLQFAWRTAAVAGAAQVLPSFARAASSVPLERAAVCIYLIGGNDSNNMIVPLDSANYAAYASGRGSLALSQSILWPVNSPRLNASFGFSPFLLELSDLYNRGKLAVMANTGLLDHPLARGSRTGLPSGLFRHESAAYASYLPNGIMMPPWAPKIQEQDPENPKAEVYSLGGASFLSPRRLHMSGDSRNNPNVIDALRKTKFQTTFPQTQIGRQLERIARVMQASSKLGMPHPVFSATMAGFDTHGNELDTHEELYRDLSLSMASFYAATEEMGIADQVVTYTQTEFNRTLRPNKTQGSEHAWGGHELIMGGAVHGGDVYGTFPSLQLGGPDDAGRDGIWIPTTSNQQYEASIATWHSGGNATLSSALDGLQNFPAGNPGFLS
ncbi:MAG TPA: DUF1501 domain-containing protein [Bryobacteraceae bacterium]|nr:DUF1501 domain-containing protein [Bryobacteraceae bacterium]